MEDFVFKDEKEKIGFLGLSMGENSRKIAAQGQIPVVAVFLKKKKKKRR